MASILTAEDVVKLIAAECAFVDERGGVGDPAEASGRDRAAVRRAIPPAAPPQANAPRAETAAAVVIGSPLLAIARAAPCPLVYTRCDSRRASRRVRTI
jgi:hypothetical protein